MGNINTGMAEDQINLSSKFFFNLGVHIMISTVNRSWIPKELGNI